MLKQFFRGPGVASPRSDSVYAAIVAAARRLWLYSRAGVPDTVSGRFDMIVLHLALVIERLRGGGPREAALAQAVLDTMFADMDRSLREMGVGDLSLAKRMRTMAGAYYGRALAYREAFAAADPAPAVAAVLARNLHPAELPPMAELARLAQHAVAFRAALAAMPIEQLANGILPDVAAEKEDGAAS
jgi:cytochrome b pre-mRNA-processing protein 3